VVCFATTFRVGVAVRLDITGAAAPHPKPSFLRGRISARNEFSSGNDVLAVDDNDVHRYTIAKLLSASGFDTLLAKNGAEALSLTATSKPDVILLDVMLPDMSGFEVCSSFRSNDSTKEIPVIIHTAVAANEVNCTRALSAGACAFITYPIDRENLVTIINGCVMRDAA
jgi:CheY-like chemotaxis protein